MSFARTSLTNPSNSILSFRRRGSITKLYIKVWQKRVKYESDVKKNVSNFPSNRRGDEEEDGERYYPV